MLPAVTEVIEIFQRLCAYIFEHVNEAGFTSVERAAAPIGIGNPPSDIFGADLIEVAVGKPSSKLSPKRSRNSRPRNAQIISAIRIIAANHENALSQCKTQEFEGYER